MAPRAVFAVLILAMFALAFGLPSCGESFLGYLVLFLGPLTGAITALSWLANPCFVIALVLFLLKKDKSAAAFAAAAFLLSLLPGLEYATYPAARFQWEPRIALAVGTDREIELRVGYFVWVSTHWHLLAGAVMFNLWDRSRNKSRG